MHLLPGKYHPDGLNEIATLLTDAFLDNPLYVCVFGEDMGAPEQVPSPSHGRSVKVLAGPRGAGARTHCPRSWGLSCNPPVDDTGRIASAEKYLDTRAMQAICICIQTCASFSYPQVGLLAVPFRTGFVSMLRLLEMIHATNFAVKPYVKGDSWTLETFAITEKSRGQGIGSTLLGLLLDHSKAPGVTITFMTQIEANVRFYSLQGFRVLSAENLLLGSSEIQNWVLPKDFSIWNWATA
jgi:ribosomal protein S18 acetylase RimI-like enzyme